MPLDPFSLNTIYKGLKETGATDALVDAARPVVEAVQEKAETVVQNAKTTILSTVLPGVKRVVDKVLPSALAASSNLQYMGSQGSFVDFLQPAYLQTTCFHMEADKHEKIGYLCHKILTLSTLSGFTLCENVQIQAAGATVEELEIIKQFLEAGVYIE